MSIDKLRKLDFWLGSILIVILRPASIALGTLLRRNHDMIVKNHLVVMKIKGGGSLLLALPALLSLRKKYPDKKFTLITSAEVKPFADLMGVFDEVVLVNTTRLLPFLFTSLKAVHKSWRADAFINFEIHSKLTTVFSCLSCARNRIGFYHETNSWQRDVITHLFFYNITSPVYVNYNQVAIALGAAIISYKEVSQYFAQRNYTGKIDARLPNGNVVLAPFCSDLGKEREFSSADWGAILLGKYGNGLNELIILGGSGDKTRAETLANVLQNTLPHTTIINKAGQTTLYESVEIICGASEFLTIDSGLNHIARLMGGGLKICSFWGPTDPTTRLAPFPDITETVVYEKLFCSPCVHVVSVPPCKGNNICMKQYARNGLNQYSTGGWLMISNSAVPKNI